MKSKIWVEIIFNGFEEHPNDISKLVGISPSEFSVKGNIYRSPNGEEIREPFNEWRLSSGCKTSLDFEEQLKVLILKFKPFSNTFLEFCKRCSPFFKVVVHIYLNESYPYLGIDDKNVLKDMATINSTFGIEYSIFEDEIDL